MTLRIRLTQKAADLDSKVRRGEGTYGEVGLANYLDRLKKHSDLLLKPVGVGPPALEGSYNVLFKDGYLECYESEVVDFAESLLPRRKDWTLPDLDKEYEISSKGLSLMNFLAYSEVSGFELPPGIVQIGKLLFGYRLTGDLPPWTMVGLAKEGYLQPVDSEEEEDLKCLD